ncbi:MAG TPA: FAD-dependent oxidoreductase [Spirochaetia bacterium]|nr:FAD-dependent oxidoreductase [Spirochaetia bacterium]
MIYDVIVVGAGVVGALTARELARYDLKVLVLEAGDDAAAGVTKANSAIVHGGYAEGPETLKGRLAAAGRRLFPVLEAELNFGFRPIGSLVVSFDPDPAPLEALYRRGLSNGLTDLELWDGPRVRTHEPNLNPAVTGALWCAGAGVCSPWDLAYAALENALAHGVEFKLHQRVVAVEGPLPEVARWRLSTAETTYETRFVVNAAGLGGGLLDALAGLHDSTLHYRTGEYLVFARDTGARVNSVLFPLPGPLGKGIVVTPTYQGNLLVGPDARDEGADAPLLGSTHADRLAHLSAQADRLVGPLDFKKAIRSFAGIRPLAPGSDFLVGAAHPGSHPGWHRAVGIQSPGLTASPALARMLVRGLSEDGLLLPPRPDFDPSRCPLPVHLSRRADFLPFAQVDALTRLPEGDPDRIVCRCEQVRERDLAEAASRGVPVLTVDALKRRTRAGMGWCQGRFCRPRTAAWLSGHLGYPVAAQEDAARSGLSRVEGRDLWDLDPSLPSR